MSVNTGNSWILISPQSRQLLGL